MVARLRWSSANTIGRGSPARVHRARQLEHERRRTFVEQRMRGVEPKTVGVVLVDPVQRVLDQKPACDR